LARRWLYLWTGTNAWFETHFARSAIERFDHTVIVGRVDRSNAALGLEVAGPPGSAFRPYLTSLMGAIREGAAQAVSAGV
jgi:hypothetical protein